MGSQNIRQNWQKEIQLRGRADSIGEYTRSPLKISVTNTCVSDALMSSKLECRLYVKHLIRKDSLIGGTKDSIELLLTEGEAGRPYIFMLNPFC